MVGEVNPERSHRFIKSYLNSYLNQKQNEIQSNDVVISTISSNHVASSFNHACNKIVRRSRIHSREQHKRLLAFEANVAKRLQKQEEQVMERQKIINGR